MFGRILDWNYDWNCISGGLLTKYSVIESKLCGKASTFLSDEQVSQLNISTAARSVWQSNFSEACSTKPVWQGTLQRTSSLIVKHDINLDVDLLV